MVDVNVRNVGLMSHDFTTSNPLFRFTLV